MIDGAAQNTEHGAAGAIGHAPKHGGTLEPYEPVIAAARYVSSSTSVSTRAVDSRARMRALRRVLRASLLASKANRPHCASTSRHTCKPPPPQHAQRALSACHTYMSRLGANGARSTHAAPPSSSSSDIASPVAGALSIPQQLCPVATYAPPTPGTPPMSGSPSRLSGR